MSREWIVTIIDAPKACYFVVHRENHQPSLSEIEAAEAADQHSES